MNINESFDIALIKTTAPGRYEVFYGSLSPYQAANDESWDEPPVLNH